MMNKTKAEAAPAQVGGKQPPLCPKCNVRVQYYDGCLGYESFQCPICHWDINDPAPVSVGGTIATWENASASDIIGRPKSAGAQVAQHTPGPWEFVPDSRSWPAVVCRDGGKHDGATIAEVYNGEANARLIAAAPELLEALAECLNVLTNYGLNHTPTKDKARAAIAKAEGKL